MTPRRRKTQGKHTKKGIELYIEDHPDVIYTYDFTHQVALWLKYYFSDNELFQNFSQRADLTRTQIQISSLSFLLPPKPSTKARFHNVDSLIKWGIRIIKYWEKQNFSRINSNYDKAQKIFLVDKS